MKSLSAAASLSPSRIQETTTGQESSDDYRGSQPLPLIAAGATGDESRTEPHFESPAIRCLPHAILHLESASVSIGPWSNDGREQYPQWLPNQPWRQRSELDQGPISFRGRRYVIVFVKPVRVIMNLKTALLAAARYGVSGFKSEPLPVRVYHDSLAQMVWVKKAGLDDTHDLCERNRGGGTHPAAV